MTNEEFGAKKYLLRLRTLYGLIKSNEAELTNLRYLSRSIGGGSDFSREKVKGGTVENRMEKQIAEIVDLENDIKKEIGEYRLLRDEVKKAIDLQEDEDERLLLKLRYIEGATWEDIAEKMDYSTRHIYRLHKVALRNFKFNRK